MLFYLALVLWLCAINVFARRFSIWFAPYFAIPIIAFSYFRGTSGKDTESYIFRFGSDSIVNIDWGLDSEPFLPLLIDLVKFVPGADHRVFFALHAGILGILYFALARKSDRLWTYLWTVGPVFLIDSVVNGMRVGLAYHFYLFGVAYGWRHLAGVLAISSHVTAVVPVSLGYALNLIGRRRAVFALSAFILFAILIVWNVAEYLPRVAAKSISYEDLEPANWYSGFSDMALIFALIYVLINNVASAAERHVVWVQFSSILVAAAFVAIAFVGIQYSVAVLRVLRLIIVAFLGAAAFCYSRLSGWQIVAFRFVGLVYIANFMRQVVFDDGFLPYGE
jgi:EpsG family